MREFILPLEVKKVIEAKENNNKETWIDIAKKTLDMKLNFCKNFASENKYVASIYNDILNSITTMENISGKNSILSLIHDRWKNNEIKDPKELKKWYDSDPIMAAYNINGREIDLPDAYIRFYLDIAGKFIVTLLKHNEDISRYSREFYSGYRSSKYDIKSKYLHGVKKLDKLKTA